jgi:hypothetical protein
VEAALAAGDHAQALALLRKQEREWGLNWSHGSPVSMIVNLEHLLWITEQLREVAPHLAATADAAAVPVRGLRDLEVMHVNHSSWGRMMSREMAKKVVQLQDEIRAGRERLRAAFD